MHPEEGIGETEDLNRQCHDVEHKRRWQQSDEPGVELAGIFHFDPSKLVVMAKDDESGGAGVGDFQVRQGVAGTELDPIGLPGVVGLPLLQRG